MRPRATALASAALLLVLLPTACHPAPDSPLGQAAAEGRTAEIERLIAAGAPVDGRDGEFTPLIWAARSGQVEALRLLVARGADPNRRAGVNDWTPVLHAIHKGQTDTAVALLEAGARLDGSIGEEALMMAAGYGNAWMVRVLLERGMDPHAGNSNGMTPLSNAVGGAWDIDYSWTGCGPHTEVVRALLERAPDLKLPDNAWGKAARLQARRKGCDEMLSLLVRPTDAKVSR